MSSTQSQPAVTPPSTRMRKEDRKRQLLEHAKQLFLTLGYQDTTTEKIARSAGVTEPVLYRHFANKKALFLEVLHAIREATLNRWRNETAKLTDPVAMLKAVTDLYLGSTREHAVEFQIMHRSLVETHDPEIAAFLRDFYLDSESLLAEMIQAGQQTGLFRPTLHPRVAAWEFIRSALGYTLTLPLGIPLYAEADYLPRAIGFLLDSLRNA